MTKYLLSFLMALLVIACGDGSTEYDIDTPTDAGAPLPMEDAGGESSEPCGTRDGRPCPPGLPGPGECEDGEILPDRLIEFRVPFDRKFAAVGPRELGRTFTASLDPIRFASPYIYDEEDLRIERRTLSAGRTEIIDPLRHSGGRQNFGLSVGDVMFQLGSGSTRTFDFQYMQSVERTTFVYLDDRIGVPSYERIPENAVWYLYGLEFGRAHQILAYDASGSNRLDVGITLNDLNIPGLFFSSGSGADKRRQLDISFGFQRWSESRSLSETQDWSGYARTSTSGCSLPRGREGFDRCFMPVDPVITHLVFRNLPRRCVPESEEDVDLPVLLTMELGELEVLDGGGADTADWNLTALCEVDDARSIVIDRVEGISLPSVSTGETIAINPDSRRVLDDLGVLPGVEIRCGVSGLVNDGTPEGRVIRYVEDRFVVPEATTEPVFLDRTLDGTGGMAPRFRLSYRVSVSPVE